MISESTVTIGQFGIDMFSWVIRSISLAVRTPMNRKPRRGGGRRVRQGTGCHVRRPYLHVRKQLPGVFRATRTGFRTHGKRTCLAAAIQATQGLPFLSRAGQTLLGSVKVLVLSGQRLVPCFVIYWRRRLRHVDI